MKRKPPIAGKREPPESGPDSDLSEEEVFARAMTGVVPITRKKGSRWSATRKRPSAGSRGPGSDAWRLDPPEGGDPASFPALRHGDPRLVKRLRRGEFRVQEEIDLHGFTQAEAHRELEIFLRESAGRGLRCVRVIHGKGKNSPEGLPVLRRKVPQWLTVGANARLVAAFVSAPPRDGGTGALHVLLRPPVPPEGQASSKRP